MRLLQSASGCVGALALWLAAGGSSAAQRPADLLAASTPAGTALVMETDIVRVHVEALTYPRAERVVAESRPVVLYVKVKSASQAESMTLLDAPPGGRLSWRAGAVPRGIRIEILKAPALVSTMRNPEADPPPGSTVEAEWDGGRLVLAAFQPMHLGEGTGSSPSVTVFLSDGMLDVSHDGVRRRMAVRAGDAFWLEARTGLRVVSDHPVGAAIVQIDPGR
jgi:hypothetical protein